MGVIDRMMGQQLYESEGQSRQKGTQIRLKVRDVECGREGRVSLSDRGLHGPAEALLLHG